MVTRNLINLISFLGRNKKKSSIRVKDIKRVLICRPNHRLGNQLLVTPLVQELTNTFPDIKIDLFLKGGLGKIIFKNYSSVERFILLPKKHFKELHKYIYCWFRLRNRKYDLVINANSDSSSGRLATQIANSKLRLSQELIPPKRCLPVDYSHFAKKPIYQFRAFLPNLGVQNMGDKIPSLNINLKQDEITKGERILSKINQNDKPTIGIFTFATLNKCYTPEFWIPFYEALKKRYGNFYNIVEVLPIENVSQINFIAPYFYSKDIRELASMINAMSIFISADCGMMHLASATKVPVVGLFKFDNIEKYKPYGNKSIGIYTKGLGIDDILVEIVKILG